MDYEPLSNTFQEVGNTIKANDYRLARIDLSRPHFLVPYDLPPVDHLILQGVPLAAQPIQQVPFGVAIAEERFASSSSSLKEEIDKFQFEEEETQGVEAIFISEVEEETYEYSCVQAPAPVITYVEDSSDDEVEEMAPKSNQSLRELMKGRNKVSTPQEANKSKPPVNPPPPPLQLLADLRLKPNPEQRRKRQHEVPDEGEIGPLKGNKQQKVVQDQRSKSSSSVDQKEAKAHLLGNKQQKVVQDQINNKNFILLRRSPNRFTWPKNRLRMLAARPRRSLMLGPRSRKRWVT